MASWKVAPALAAGNTAILKPAVVLAADGDPARRAGARGRHPGRRPQRRHRPGRHGRRGDRRPSGHRQGRVHRRDDDRPGDHAAGLGQREEDQPRARRQEPEHRLRRRRPREVRPRVALLRSSTTAGQDCCARSRILVERSVHEQVVELFADGDPERQGRRPGRRGDRGRHARQLQAARAGRGLHRDRASARARRSSSAAAPRTIRRWPAART